LITINLAEADDADRERQRTHMHEPYRTLVGHFRHEIAAHYLHMVDTLETASVFGMRVRPRPRNNTDLSATIDFDPHDVNLHQLIDAWLPLTFAFNSINRSMGLPDLYPLVLSPPVIVKLTYIYELIRTASGRASGEDKSLHAIVVGLKCKVGMAGMALDSADTPALRG
jgi:hypothetical protein